VGLPADEKVPITPQAPARSDTYTDYPFPMNVTLSLTVVSNSATKIDATDWAVVKTNGFVTIQASLSNTNAAPLLKWSGGGQAVPGNPLQWQVSAATSAETTVTASLGPTNLSLNVWVIWANLIVRTSGTLDPDDKAAELVNGNWATPTAFNVTYLGGNGFGGGNSLGPIDRFSNTNLNYDYVIGKKESKAILQPIGIGKLLSSTNIWKIQRASVSIAWDNGLLTYTSGGALEVDSSSSGAQYMDPTNGYTFDLDTPGCPYTLGATPNHTSEVYDNLYEIVSVNLGGINQVCSSYGTFSYSAQIDFDATNVNLNSLSTSLINLPTTSYYSKR
jgi:hypothetical protein